LDDLLELHGFDSVKLIKLDIEGSELFALDGLQRTLASHPAAELIIEVNEPACRAAGYTGAELLQELERLGFRLFGMFGRQLVEQAASDLRFLYCMDFLAVRSPSFVPPPDFFVAPLEYEISVSLILSQLESPFMVCRRYMAEALSAAPPIVADDRIRRALDRLEFDPEKIVRRSITWWEEKKGENGKLAIPLDSAARLDTSKSKEDSTRLAIVGSESAFCGIASYIRHITKYLEPCFDLIDVRLQQRSMSDRTPAGRRVAFDEVASAAALLRQADWVNLHLEPGTLGTMPGDIVDRFKTLVENARRLIVTFHSVGRPEASACLTRFGQLVGGRLGRLLISEAYQHLQLNFVWRQLFEVLKRARRRGRVAMIAHTKADAHLLRTFGFREVYDHPLSYLNNSELDRLKGSAFVRSNMLNGSSGIVKLGLFGFISPYKGILAAVEALRYLPSNFRLIIQGSIHPMVGLDHQECDDYLRKILQRIEQAQLIDRIDFRESPDDNGFLEAMQAVDIVLCPYMEMRQSASGPAKMAIELEKPLVCTRTESFLELAGYYPNRIRLIDIGNYVQLAQTVQAIAHEFASSGSNGNRKPLESPRYTAETLRDLYCKIILGAP
jgi:glycosyltransferase involved in cell wall biosynthesis